MMATLFQKSVGPWPMNSYIVFCQETQKCAIIDPGDEADSILRLVEDASVDAILLTHGHSDHILALGKVKEQTAAPVHLHPEDAEKFDLNYDIPLQHGQLIPIGNTTLTVIHTPGHTLGQCCFDMGDGRIIVGDTIFAGGPGRTWSSEDFSRTMETMADIVFQWPDQTEFFPGHGSTGKILNERPAFEAFCAHGWPKNLYGDVTWKIGD